MGVVSRIGGFVGTALLATAIGAEAQALNEGAAVFAAQKCSMCHALDGKGNAKMAFLAAKKK